jgi:hypothetical protein
LPLYRRTGGVLGEAHCILGLGDIALRNSDHEISRKLFREALTLFSRIQEPYSIGRAHVRLARLAELEERKQHVEEARKAWARIKRPDLVALLDQEFGAA